ncbi:MAG: helix-turn-helix domain-containing protein [Candidatus Dormibacteraceae bacterium]
MKGEQSSVEFAVVTEPVTKPVHTFMSKGLRGLMEEIEQEARAEGHEAVQQLEILHSYYHLFGQFLILRQSTKMSQSELAHASGITQSEISKIERGLANPTVSTLLRLVVILGGSMDIVNHRSELAHA